MSCKSVLINGLSQDIVMDSVGNNQELNVYKIKSLPDETFLKGAVVVYQNKNWLIYECDLNDEIYTVGYMKYCPYTLKFQNSVGEILSYPYFIDTSSSSTADGKFIITSDSTRTIKLSFDDNTKLFSYGKRFMGDVINNIPQCWKITDWASKDGVLSLILEKDEYNVDTDNITLCVCDYKTAETSNSDYMILCTKDIDESIYFGREYLFYIDTTNIYTMQTNNESIGMVKENEYWKIKIDDTNFIGQSFAVQGIIGDITISKTLVVRELY